MTDLDGVGNGVLDAATQLISHPAPGDRATRTSRLLLTRAINGDKV